MTVILFPEPATLRRFTGFTLDDDGFATKDDAVTHPIAGSVQPVSRRDLNEELKTEGVTKVIFVDTNLYLAPRPASIPDKLPADEIDFNGETFRVVSTEVWTTGNAHCKAFLTRNLA